MIKSLINPHNNKKFNLNNPFTKNAILNEIRSCANINASEVPKYIEVLSKLIYILSHDGKLGESESLDTFFGITNLFKFSDPTLRRLIYMAVRELAPDPASAIVIYNFVIKDMADNNCAVSCSAFRVVYSIFDKDLFQSANMMRNFKQSIDNYSSLDSCHALAVLHELIGVWPDIGRTVLSSLRQIYITTNNLPMQYHAAALLYRINSRDSGTVQQNVLEGRSFCYQTISYNIKIALKLLTQAPYSDKNRELYLFVTKSLFGKPMVANEAAAALVNFYRHKNSDTLSQETKTKDIKQLLNVLFGQLNDTGPEVKFMALKTLNKAIEIHEEVSSKNIDVLQSLLNDSNRCVVTLAINALLKVCPENNVEKLMTRMGGMMQDIPDQFRTIVIDSIKNVARKFTRTHKALMKFLTQMFRSQSGLKCKSAIVSTIQQMMNENPSSRESGLLCLCEFMEDCDHMEITCRILHLISAEAPSTPNPFRFIRFIYNRITLDTPRVRASAVSALARIGFLCQDLCATVITILGRLVTDLNDEIRDRATFFHHLLKLEDRPRTLCLGFELLSLRQSLLHYTSDTPSDCPFNPDTCIQPSAVEPGSGREESVFYDVPVTNDIYEEHCCSTYEGIGELVLTSANVVSLSDDESDFVVKCRKLVYSDYISFVFNVVNTLPDVDIGDVHVEMVPTHQSSYSVIQQAKADRISGNSSALVSVLFSMGSNEYDCAEFRCCLKFGVCDDHGLGCAERYELDKVSIDFSDFVLPPSLDGGFDAAWADLGEDSQRVEVLCLPDQRGIKEGIALLMDFYKLEAFGGSEKAGDKMSHMLMMGGKVKGALLLVMAKLFVESGGEGDHLIAELAVRSEDLELANIFINLLYS